MFLGCLCAEFILYLPEYVFPCYWLIACWTACYSCCKSMWLRSSDRSMGMKVKELVHLSLFFVLLFTRKIEDSRWQQDHFTQGIMLTSGNLEKFGVKQLRLSLLKVGGPTGPSVRSPSSAARCVAEMFPWDSYHASRPDIGSLLLSWGLWVSINSWAV